MPDLHDKQADFVVCIDDHDYEGDLRLHKIYRVIPDADPRVKEDGLIRVVDESGEDYLYPASRFTPIAVPNAVEKSLLKAS